VTVEANGPAIRLAGAGKRYRHYEDSAVLISKGLGRIRRTKRSHLWALRGIDLEVDDSDCLGVIGRNGGGKTTMLQLLAGVTGPTEGRVTVRGRVAPLMAVGVGFHPELTGRENVFINATILGRKTNEIAAEFDNIVGFADIGTFIDTPIKFYSSGMIVRLGFSVAIRSNPDVLLVDEVLAVGDLAFQARCFDRMQQIREDGTTVVVVSHNLDAIRTLCDRTLMLNQGQAVFLGPTSEALSIYHQLLDEIREPEHDDGFAEGRAGQGAVAIASAELLDQTGLRSSYFDSGSDITVRVTGAGEPGASCPDIELVVSTGAGLVSYRERWPLDAQLDPAGGLRCDLVFPAHLPTGTYTVAVALRSPGADTLLSSVGPIAFYVSGRRRVRGLADLRASFDEARAIPRV
jgi:ABC-2 type transport system ATP-binding protein